MLNGWLVGPSSINRVVAGSGLNRSCVGDIGDAIPATTTQISLCRRYTATKKLTIDGDLLQLANLYQPRISDRQHQSIGAVGAGIVSPTSPTHDQPLSCCSKFRKSEPRNFTDCVTNSGRTSLGSGFSRACLVRPSFIRL